MAITGQESSAMAAPTPHNYHTTKYLVTWAAKHHQPTKTHTHETSGWGLQPFVALFNWRRSTTSQKFWVLSHVYGTA
jgi:hypothetical protein